jgi:ribosomal protein L22
MADEKKPAEKKPAEKKPAEKKPAAKPRAKAAPKAGEPKTAAKPRARKTAATKAEAKPAAEAKAAAKPAARRRPAAKKPAAETKPPAKAEAPKPKPAAKPKEPVRPLVRAQAKYVRSSARKARLVMDHVRGRSVSDARALLRHSPRGVARDVERLLNSAIANAENNHELVGDDLYVKEIYADEGPTLRRFRPRAQGRATRIRKRTSHLTVGLSTKE